MNAGKVKLESKCMQTFTIPKNFSFKYISVPVQLSCLNKSDQASRLAQSMANLIFTHQMCAPVDSQPM